MTGRRTVPNVFVKGQSIGGGDDTERLYNSGELQKMVEGLLWKACFVKGRFLVSLCIMGLFVLPPNPHSNT